MGELARSALRAVIGRLWPVRCLACARGSDAGGRLISGPGIYLCIDCTAEAALRVRPSDLATLGHYTCSFCGANSVGVRLGQAQKHAVCRDCLHIAERVFAEDART